MKVCQQCNSDYSPVHKPQKFCSYTCAAHSRSQALLINGTHKYCKQCEQLKELKDFGRHSGSRLGLRPKCKTCVNQLSRERYEKQCSRETLVPTNLSCSRCKELKPVSAFHHLKKSPTGFASHCIVCDKRWRQNYLSSPSAAESKRKSSRKFQTRRREDSKARLRDSVSRLVYQVLKSQDATKKYSVLEALPYSMEDLLQHLESQFDNEMSWENYGSQWQLDHIIPQAYFAYDSLESENFLNCWALDNLQPLCPKENASKGSLFEGIRHIYKKGEK